MYPGGGGIKHYLLSVNVKSNWGTLLVPQPCQQVSWVFPLIYLKLRNSMMCFMTLWKEAELCKPQIPAHILPTHHISLIAQTFSTSHQLNTDSNFNLIKVAQILLTSSKFIAAMPCHATLD